MLCPKGMSWFLDFVFKDKDKAKEFIACLFALLVAIRLRLS